VAAGLGRAVCQAAWLIVKVKPGATRIRRKRLIRRFGRPVDSLAFEHTGALDGTIGAVVTAVEGRDIGFGCWRAGAGYSGSPWRGDAVISVSGRRVRSAAGCGDDGTGFAGAASLAGSIRMLVLGDPGRPGPAVLIPLVMAALVTGHGSPADGCRPGRPVSSSRT
jgi:hypothetical protein